MKGEFGFLPFIAGTFWCTVVAIVLALPVSLLMAVYLTEYARPQLHTYAYPLLDILAGLPSVIYGVWGSLLIVPWISHTVAPFAGPWRDDSAVAHFALHGTLCQCRQ